MLSLRQLEVFIAIANRGSTTAAAEEVARSQSAVSSALSELETHLGVNLFDRVGRRLVLNDNGQRFYPQAQMLMQQAEDVSGLFTKGGGQLRIGASTTIGNHVLPAILARSENQCCRRIDIANTGEIATRVANCELDLGLVEGHLQHPDLSISRWQTDEMVIVAASDSPWSKLSDDAGLTVAPWIMREPGSGTRSMVEAQLLSNMETVNVALEIGSSEAILNAVITGLGISCLSRHIVHRSLASGELVQIAHQRVIRRHFNIIHHRQRQPTDAVEAFISLCIQAHANHGHL